jgi:putative PIN family toxin of toxin-antitoxin system
LRAVLDVNVLISAMLSSRGSSATIVRAWRDGEFDLIVSPLLLYELQRALNYPKIRRIIAPEESHQFVQLLEREAILIADPNVPPPTRSPDPGDDYLLALAASNSAVLVTHDPDLLSLREQYPIRPPAEFLEMLGSTD